MCGYDHREPHSFITAGDCYCNNKGCAHLKWWELEGAGSAGRSAHRRRSAHPYTFVAASASDGRTDEITSCNRSVLAILYSPHYLPLSPPSLSLSLCRARSGVRASFCLIRQTLRDTINVTLKKKKKNPQIKITSRDLYLNTGTVFTSLSPLNHPIHV